MAPTVENPGDIHPRDTGSFGLDVWYDGGAEVDIVFIHGLMGHNVKTWKLSKANEHDEPVPWPRALLPKAFPKSRIFTFGYDAQVVKKNGRQITSKVVGDHAKELIYLLGHHRLKTKSISRPIIFVCHSLGGLVCKDAFLHSKVQTDSIFHDISESTAGIVFMGTPHTGSAIANYADRLAWFLGRVVQTNKQWLELLKTNSEILGRIHEDFCLAIRETSKSKKSVELVCFWEELKSGSVVIVPKQSATIAGYRSRGIRDDHGGMVKFTGESDPGYIAFVEELRWLIDKTISNDTPTPSSLHIEEPEEEFQLSTTQYPIGPVHGSAPPEGPWFMIPYSKNDVFIGRTTNLQQLHNWLGSPSENQRQGIHKRAALHGLGGVGKTQVALQWAYELQQKHPYLSIFWVHASTTDRIIESYSTIASTCQIPNCKPNDPQTLGKVKQWLTNSNNKTPWLMIVDNADDIEVFFQQQDEETAKDHMGKYIPESPNGTILFTTRSKRAALNLTRGRNLFVVEEPTTAESVQMMQARLPEDMYTEAELERLADHLGNLPLAMVQATSYLQLNSLSVSKYLERLGDSGEDALIGMLENEFEEAGRDMGTDQRVPNAVARTWLMSFQNIEKQDPLAIEILNLCGCFDRQEIPKAFFEEYRNDYEWYNETLFKTNTDKGKKRSKDRNGSPKQEKKKQGWRKSMSGLKSHWRDLVGSKKEKPIAEPHNEIWDEGPSQPPDRFGMLPYIPTTEDVEKALALLMTYSFIIQGRDENTFTLHRLVHLVIKKRLMKNKQMAEYSTKAMSILKVILHPVRYEWPEVRKLRPHVDSVFSCGPMRLDCPDAAEEKVSILIEVGEFLFFSGTHREQGIKMFQEAVELRQEVKGRTHELTVRIHADWIYYDYLYTDPIYGASLLEPLMNEASAALGESNNATLWVVRRLADIYYEGNEHNKAAQLHDRYIDQAMADDTEPDDITAIGFRRNSLGLQGRLHEALALSRWVLNKLENERPNEICDILALTWLVLVASGEEQEGLAILSMLARLNDQRYGKQHTWSVEAQRKLRDGRQLIAKGESIRTLDNCILDFMAAEEKVANKEMEKAPLDSQFISDIAKEFAAGQALGDALPKTDWRQKWAWTHYSYFKDDWRECSHVLEYRGDAGSELSGSTVDNAGEDGKGKEIEGTLEGNGKPVDFN